MPEAAFNKFLSIIFVVVMLLPVASMAAETGGATDNYIFKLMDMDGNQEIDRSEFATQKMMVFYVRDINRDLKLSASELPALADSLFKKFDTDGDGSVAAIEFNQAKVGMFENLDGNADGIITFVEFEDFNNKTK